MIALAPAVMATPKIERDYLSWSAVSAFLRCPLRYFFRYVEQLPEEFIAGNLVFGSAVHASLEEYFRHLLTTGQRLDLDPLLAVYHHAWSEVDVEGVQFGKGDDLVTYTALAERMLATFLAHEFAQQPGTILGVEEELRSGVIPGVPDLLARLDLLQDTGAELVLTDFKTSRSRWSEADVEASAGQLLVYHELVTQFADKPVRLQFAVLTKTKQSQLDVHTVAVDPQRIARIRQLIERVWRAIQGGHFYPAPSVMNCSGCPFQRACQSW